MDLETIRTLYDYHYWATDRILAAAEQITDEQFTTSKGHSFDTIQGTLVHLMNSEKMWLERWHHQPNEAALNPKNYSMMNEARMYWDMLRMKMEKFLGELTADRLNEVIRYTNLEGKTFEYPLWQMMTHVIGHGQHHRSEVSTMLTEFGHANEPIDMIVYFRIKSGQ